MRPTAAGGSPMVSGSRTLGGPRYRPPMAADPTRTPIIVLGAGGFGREVLDVIEAMNAVAPQWEFLGFVDDGPPDLDRLARRHAPFLGSSEALGSLPSGTRYAIGIGDPTVRRRLDEAA